MESSQAGGTEKGQVRLGMLQRGRGKSVKELRGAGTSPITTGSTALPLKTRNPFCGAVSTHRRSTDSVSFLTDLALSKANHTLGTSVNRVGNEQPTWAKAGWPNSN